MSEEGDSWLNTAFGIDVGQVLESVQSMPVVGQAADAMPAPSSAPGLLEEAEAVVESGVRAVVRAAPEVIETAETAVEVAAVATVAPGALAVGGAAFAATMLWSNTSIPAWEGRRNPETGQSFTSQEEYDRYQAALRDKKKDANTQTLDRHDEERYAEGIVNDGTTDCDALIEAIKGVTKALRERHDAMGESGGGDPGHVQRYEAVQELLKKLIARAKANECAIDTSEAEEWSTYPAP